MIENKKELNLYIKKDKEKSARRSRPMYIGDEIGKYLYYLRKNEYFNNKKQMSIYNKIMSFFYRYKQHRLGIKLGFDIPINVFEEGLRIDHWGFLAVSGNSKIGKNCHIYGDVTIGISNDRDHRAPIIGDNVTIGAGTRIIGPIKIASNSVIGANSVVVKDITEPDTIVGGIPAKKLK